MVAEETTFSSAWEQAANAEEQSAALDQTFEKGKYRGIVKEYVPKQESQDWSPYYGHPGEVVTLQIALQVGDKIRTKLEDVSPVKREGISKKGTPYLAQEYIRFSKLAKALGMLGQVPKSVLEAAKDKPLQFSYGRSPRKKDGVETGDYDNNLNDIKASS